MASPHLIVVSGPPGTGKTSLAHKLAAAIPCPAICRDEIKEGAVHALPGHEPTLGGPFGWKIYETFFEVIRLFVEHEVTVVAEAAFQHKLWAPKLIELGADLRVIHCTVDPAVARDRIVKRAETDPLRALAHADAAYVAAVDAGERSISDYDPIHLDVPTLRVDTTDGYDPAFPEIVAFAREPVEVTGTGSS